MKKEASFICQLFFKMQGDKKKYHGCGLWLEMTKSKFRNPSVERPLIRKSTKRKCCFQLTTVTQKQGHVKAKDLSGELINGVNCLWSFF